MVAVVGTRFCKTACPYAMLQNVLADRETLAVAFDPARAECLRCDRCTRVCPVGIDIRKGGQRECVACAACIDACREVTSRGTSRPSSPTVDGPARESVPVRGGCLAAALVLLAAVWSRPDVRFAVRGRESRTPRGTSIGTPAERLGRPFATRAVRRTAGATPRRSGGRGAFPGTRNRHVDGSGGGRDAGRDPDHRRGAGVPHRPEGGVPVKRLIGGLFVAFALGTGATVYIAHRSWDGLGDRQYPEAAGVQRGVAATGGPPQSPHGAKSDAGGRFHRDLAGIRRAARRP